MTADHVRFLAIVVVATVIAHLWCRAFPVGHERLIWRRLRACLHRPKLSAHDRVICMNLPRHPAR